MATDFFAAGIYRCELVSADVERILDAVLRSGLLLENVSSVDELTVRFEIPGKDMKKMERIVHRKGGSVTILGKSGMIRKFRGLLHRPALVLSIVLILLSAAVLPTRICFIQVEGNVKVPSRLILEQAENCGVSFWASSREVRSEKVKNALLGAIPELSWVGVNTKGCVATISVRERSAGTPKQTESPVSSIIAVRDGIVRDITVTKGNALCKTGQAVKAGEILISGYTDLGIALRATGAEGEIYAETVHDLTAVIPTDHVRRGEATAVLEKFTLIIGKKRINLSKDSGILDMTCDKMTVTEYLTLPGGFQFPVALQREIYTFYEDTQTALLQEDAVQVLEDFAQNYLTQQMVAGQITDQTLSWDERDGCFLLSGFYRCYEMIGQLRTEEIVK